MSAAPGLRRLATAILLAAGAAGAAETQPLAVADDPFEITDPLAARPGEAELNVVGTYQRDRSGPYRGLGAIDSEWQMGVARRLEIRIGQSGAYGNIGLRGRPGTLEAAGFDPSLGVPATGGATRLGALYQLTDENGPLPVISILGRVRTIYGRDRPAHEADLFALVGASFGTPDRPFGFNLNIGGVQRFNPIRGERPATYAISTTVAQGLSRDTLAVAGYVRRQQERGERDFSLVEIGLRHRISEDAPIFGLALGFGTNRDTPRWRLSIAAQWSFGGDGR